MWNRWDSPHIKAHDRSCYNKKHQIYYFELIFKYCSVLEDGTATWDRGPACCGFNLDFRTVTPPIKNIMNVFPVWQFSSTSFLLLAGNCKTSRFYGSKLIQIELWRQVSSKNSKIGSAMSSWFEKGGGVMIQAAEKETVIRELDALLWFWKWTAAQLTLSWKILIEQSSQTYYHCRLLVSKDTRQYLSACWDFDT